VPALLPGLVAAAVGYLLFIGVGDWGGVSAFTLAVPGLPAYDGTSIGALAVAVAVGVVAAAVVAPIQRSAAVAAAWSRRRGMAVPLLLGALAVGALALMVRALGGDSQDELFSGQAALPGVAAEGSVAILVLMLLAKAVAYGICLGCGFRGGPVFPPIFLGIAAAMIPVVVFDMSPTLAVAVGAAAGMAAATRMLFSPVLFAALLVGSGAQATLPAAVLASAAAWLTATALRRARDTRDQATRNEAAHNEAARDNAARDE
jgi:H+/Cl- antiporter ClcA